MALLLPTRPKPSELLLSLLLSTQTAFKLHPESNIFLVSPSIPFSTHMFNITWHHFVLNNCSYLVPHSHPCYSDVHSTYGSCTHHHPMAFHWKKGKGFLNTYIVRLFQSLELILTDPQTHGPLWRSQDMPSSPLPLLKEAFPLAWSTLPNFCMASPFTLLSSLLRGHLNAAFTAIPAERPQTLTFTFILLYCTVTSITLGIVFSH